MVDEIELVSGLKEVAPLRAEAFEEARARLQETMGPAHRQPRRRAWAIWSTAGLGIAAAATAVTLVITSVPQQASPGGQAVARHTGSHATSPGAHTPLIRLAAAITARSTPLPGDATLIIRTQVNAAGQSTGGGADLYTDSGAYYYAQTESGLPAQIAAHNDTSGGGFARELAAARYAVHGDLSTARQRMAIAMLDPHLPKLTWRQQVAQIKAIDRAKHVKIPIPVLRRRPRSGRPPWTTRSGRTRSTLCKLEPASPRSGPVCSGCCPPCRKSPSTAPTSTGRPC